MTLPPSSTPSRSRRGFTLFEVALSLALVTFGVVSLMMLFATGARAQQLSRFQIIASAKALEMIDTFATSTNSNLQMEREGPNPWDTIGSYRSYAPDLEAHIATFRSGLYPLPLDIARRLDSDGDEIRRILDDGGYLYYSQPLATTGFNPVGVRADLPLPNESQKLLCAVTGYAQQNAITMLSYKDWPYYTAYPSPPLHTVNYRYADSKPTSRWNVYDNSSPNSYATMLWEDTLEADGGDMALVYQAIVKGADLPLTTLWVDSPDVIAAGYRRSSGYWAYGDAGGWILDYFRPKNSNGSQGAGVWRQANPDGGKANNTPPYDVQPDKLPNGRPNPVYTNPAGGSTTSRQLAREAALAYFALAKWYAARKNVSTAILDGVPLQDDGALLDKATLFSPSATTYNPSLAVNAARLLAHAAMCVTMHFLPVGANDETITVGQLDVIREGSAPYVGRSPAFVLNRATIQAYHDNCLKLGMRLAASFPYDWGSPRPLNRALMSDFPLMQYDPFGKLVTADTTTIPGYSYGTTAQQWRIITGQPLVNVGRSLSYPSQNLAAAWPGIASAGPPNHFTLGRPFSGADRCRQLVFFAVDWQSYEDFETAPSAPVDASRYPKLAPQAGRTSAASLMDGEFGDRHQYGTRNPEKTLAFLQDPTGLPTGADIPIGGVDNMGSPDKGAAGKAIFSGRFGADRNCNGTTVGKDGSGNINRIYGKLDRGPVPPSIRMRAITVARFNFYDPRLPVMTR
jgi:hypothetical protein